MSTPFTNIYNRSINLFDDPVITKAYNSSPIDFFKIMYNYLLVAIPLFVVPKTVQATLANRTSPSGQVEVFDGDGSNKTFVLSTMPTDDAFFQYEDDGTSIIGTYDSNTNSVTMDSAPSLGNENVSIEWYSVGQFTSTLSDREENILAMLLVQSWAFKERNYVLDIKRLLSDSDMKLASESANMREKNNWYNSLRENINSEMKLYSWDIYTDSLRQKYGLQS